jgi:hypothetical protein
MVISLALKWAHDIMLLPEPPGTIHMVVSTKNRFSFSGIITAGMKQPLATPK